MNKNKKKVVIIVGILLIVGIIIGVSYAWWSNYAVQQSINKITSDCLRVEIEDINNSAINLEKAYPITDAEANLLTPYTFKVKNMCDLAVSFGMQLEIMDLGDNQIDSQYLAADFNGNGKKLLSEYTSVDPTYNLKTDSKYNSSDYTANEARYLAEGYLNGKEEITYSLKVWIDESVTINDPVMNKEWIGKISVTSSFTQITTNILAEMLIEKSKSDTSIEEITHEATTQTPALTDYRYVGKNPNNYVYFGCSDNCTEDNLYRIIGVIPTQSSSDGEYENRVKLIKANYYTENESDLLLATNATLPAPGGKGYNWNSSANNQWQASVLQSEVLNGVFYSSLGEYQKYIAPAVWYLGAPIYSSYTTYIPDQFYSIERSTTSGKSGGVVYMTANIGLMYPSDYGYSIGIENSNQAIYENRENYVTNTWLYNLESKYYEWTMTPETSGSGVDAWYLNPAGYVYSDYVYNSISVWGIRPTFYLKSNVLYSKGDGSISNPYRLAL